MDNKAVLTWDVGIIKTISGPTFATFLSCTANTDAMLLIFSQILIYQICSHGAPAKPRRLIFFFFNFFGSLRHDNKISRQ